MALDLSMMTGREELVGLDIGESSVSAAKLKVGHGGVLEVSNAGSMTYAPGAGDREITSAIVELWRRCQMSSTTVCSCLRSPSLLARPFQHPSLTDSEVGAALRLVAEEEFQRAGDQLQLDWHLFSADKATGVDQGARRTEGFLVAVLRTETQRHVKLLETANLYPAIVDIGCTAIANLYLALQTEARRDEVVCLLHLNGHWADLAIIYGEDRLYPRFLYSPSKPWAEAWDRLAEDVRAEFRHFQFKLQQQAVQRVLLLGDLSVPAELAGRMQDSLALPVQHWEPLKDPRVHLPRTLPGEINSLSATSLGLALRMA